MATNKRDLKAYSRFDGTGRIVPGSTVLRRNKPKVGKWKEIVGYECCNPSVFEPIQLCGPNACADCTLFTTYYIYINVIEGIPFPYLLNSKDPSDYALEGTYKNLESIPTNNVIVVGKDGKIENVAECA